MEYDAKLGIDQVLDRTVRSGRRPLA